MLDRCTKPYGSSNGKSIVEPASESELRIVHLADSTS
jgi:hypothetical protein